MRLRIRWVSATGIVLMLGILFGLCSLALPLMICGSTIKSLMLLCYEFLRGCRGQIQLAKWWLIDIALLSAWSGLSFRNGIRYDLSELRPNGLAYDELSEAGMTKAFQPLVVGVLVKDLLTVRNHAAEIVAIIKHRINVVAIILFCHLIRQSVLRFYRRFETQSIEICCSAGGIKRIFRC